VLTVVVVVVFFFFLNRYVVYGLPPPFPTLPPPLPPPLPKTATDGESVRLAGEKDLGTCELYPQQCLHNNNGRF
jgi:hypothetical protein